MGDNNPLTAYFKGIPIFATLKPEDLNEMLRCVKLISLDAGRSVFEEGDRPDGAYLVVSGRLEAFFTLDGGEKVTLTHIGPKEFFGELALIDGEPRSAGVRAEEKSELVKIEVKEFEYLRRNHRPAAYKLIREVALLVCERLRRINSQIIDVLNPEPVVPAQNEQERQTLLDRLFSRGWRR